MKELFKILTMLAAIQGWFWVASGCGSNSEKSECVNPFVGKNLVNPDFEITPIEQKPGLTIYIQANFGCGSAGVYYYGTGGEGKGGVIEAPPLYYPEGEGEGTAVVPYTLVAGEYTVFLLINPDNDAGNVVQDTPLENGKKVNVTGWDQIDCKINWIIPPPACI